MSVEETIAAQYRARMELMLCARYRRDRNDIIRRARQLGIPITEIAAILHMNRGHISDIANGKEPGGTQGAS